MMTFIRQSHRRFLNSTSAFLLALQALGALHPVWGAEKSGCLDRSLQQIISNQENAFGKQETFRGLAEYQRDLPTDFSKIIKQGVTDPNFHWFDSGGGAGVAVLESMIPGKLFGAGKRVRHRATVLSVEDIRTKIHKMSLQELETMFVARDVSGPYLTLYMQKMINYKKYQRGIEKKGKFIYRSGRKLRELNPNEIMRSDLITDDMGVFSYDPEKIKVLLWYARNLKKSGVAFVNSNNAHVEIQNADGRPTEFSSLFRLLSKVPGFKSQDGTMFTLRIEKGTIEALENLDRHLRLNPKESYLKGMPPIFHYEWVP